VEFPAVEWDPEKGEGPGPRVKEQAQTVVWGALGDSREKGKGVAPLLSRKWESRLSKSTGYVATKKSAGSAAKRRPKNAPR